MVWMFDSNPASLIPLLMAPPIFLKVGCIYIFLRAWFVKGTIVLEFPTKGQGMVASLAQFILIF